MNFLAPISMTGTPGSLWKCGTISSLTPALPALRAWDARPIWTQYRPSGQPVDLAGGVFANRADGDRARLAAAGPGKNAPLPRILDQISRRAREAQERYVTAVPATAPDRAPLKLRQMTSYRTSPLAAMGSRCFSRCRTAAPLVVFDPQYRGTLDRLASSSHACRRRQNPAVRP
jgi:hypothetical protein